RGRLRRAADPRGGAAGTLHGPRGRGLPREDAARTPRQDRPALAHGLGLGIEDGARRAVRPASRRAAAAWLASILGSIAACAPIAPYRGLSPAPGALTAFAARAAERSTAADPWARLEPGSTSRSLCSVGTL